MSDVNQVRKAVTTFWIIFWMFVVGLVYIAVHDAVAYLWRLVGDQHVPVRADTATDPVLTVIDALAAIIVFVSVWKLRSSIGIPKARWPLSYILLAQVIAVCNACIDLAYVIVFFKFQSFWQSAWIFSHIYSIFQSLWQSAWIFSHISNILCIGVISAAAYIGFLVSKETGLSKSMRRWKMTAVAAMFGYVLPWSIIMVFNALEGLGYVLPMSIIMVFDALEGLGIATQFLLHPRTPILILFLLGAGAWVSWVLFVISNVTMKRESLAAAEEKPSPGMASEETGNE